MEMSFRKKIKNFIPNSDLLRMISYAPLINDFDFSKSTFFENRELLYNFLFENYILPQKKHINYLEFGVFKGASIKEWLNLDNNSLSRFYGFDTFTGLPEKWKFADGVLEAGHFSTDGQTPITDDKRVVFIKGLFQDTLYHFLKENEINESSTLVIHNDSDLYTSTHFCLAVLNTKIKSGSIIIFDEFSSPMEEMRAFLDYVNSFRRQYKIIANTKGYEQVAIQII